MTEPTSEQSIFWHAIGLPSPTERRAYLDEVCRDRPGRRADLDALLAAHDRLDGGPPTTGELGVAAPPEAVGATLAGRYHLLEALGEGGMGAVWLAQQTEPIKRLVAVKLIKDGMDTRQVLARFEAERQALALMDHPNIAKVHDAGTTPAGRPFFAMELVQGLPITRYCDEHRLTPRQRLELFVPVCQAIQHAHQKGVIHRDVKPSNVLVGQYDERPVPKVIDFGIAKAAGTQLTDRTQVTDFGSIVGTLEYMSPEQAEVNQLDIDTRSDIYSLGVLLYELLVGGPPFSRKELQKVGMLEMLRVIREEEPSKPSTRLSTADGLPTLAVNRGTEPTKLTKLVRGELDWIVMKALEKDRNRRYETANAFALDVQRYLADEPVQAGPPSATYRLRKFVRRNRGPVLAAALVALALVAGIVGTGLGLLAAVDARNDAQRSAAKAKEEEGKAQGLAKRERTAREEKEQQLLRAEWLLYASQINLALQAWDSHQHGLAMNHLQACRRDWRDWEHDYLTNLFRVPHRIVRWQQRAIPALALSADGTRVVGSGVDGSIKVWDADTGRNTLTLAAHGDSVFGLALSPDGTRLVSGGHADQSVALWDLTAGKELLRIKDSAPVFRVALSPDGRRIVSCNRSGAIRVWDVTTSKPLLTIQGGVGNHRIALSADGTRIVHTSLDKAIKLWDAATGRELLTVHDNTFVSSVAVSADGKRLVSGNKDGVVKVWDATTGRHTLTLKGHTEAVGSVAVSLDGTRIVSGSDDRTARVWDASTGEELRVLKGHEGYATAVAVSADGRRVVSSSPDATVRVWDVAAPQETPILGLLPACVAFRPDGTGFVTAGYDGELVLWDTTTGRKLLDFQPPERNRLGGGTQTLTFTPDGKRLIGNAGTLVYVWDAVSGQVLRALGVRLHAYAVIDVRMTLDGKRLVSVRGNGTVQVWDEAGGVDTVALESMAQVGAGLALSPDARFVVGGRGDGKVQVWDATTGRQLWLRDGHPLPVSRVAVNVDGTRILSGGEDHTVKVWDATTGEVVQTFHGHRAGIAHVALTPNGQRVVASSYDRKTKVWDAVTGFETLTLKGTALALSPDGRLILYAHPDRTVRIWNGSRGK